VDYPLRTLLFDLFAQPSLRVLQVALELEVIVSTAGLVASYVFGCSKQQTQPSAVIPK